MDFDQSSDYMVALFASIRPVDPDVAERKVFGYPALFVNGNMFASLFGDSLIIRLSDTDRVTFLAEQAAKIFEPTPGRAMKEYAVIPSKLYRDTSVLNEWLSRSLNYARSLPPKKSAPK